MRFRQSYNTSSLVCQSEKQPIQYGVEQKIFYSNSSENELFVFTQNEPKLYYDEIYIWRFGIQSFIGHITNLYLLDFSHCVCVKTTQRFNR